MVMQVLVLAAQNAVDYEYLGVASSGSTLFRQIGGSIGVAVFGAIFANQLTSNLANDAADRRAASRLRRTRPALKQLPPAVHAVYVTAVTDALHPVFLVAAGIAARRICPHLAPARDAAEDDRAGTRARATASTPRETTTACARSSGPSPRSPRATSAGRCTNASPPAQARPPPPPLWLLARLGERTPLTARQLEEQLDGDDRQFESELEELGKRGLVHLENDGTITLTTAGRAGYERLVAVRRARLSELLSGWEPEQHHELEELVERLARDLASEIPKDPGIASGS